MFENNVRGNLPKEIKYLIHLRHLSIFNGEKLHRDFSKPVSTVGVEVNDNGLNRVNTWIPELYELVYLEEINLVWM
jgi:hypothetical protein